MILPKAWLSSSTLRRGLEKVSAARGHKYAPLFALSPAWEHEFLFPSMAFNTANAFDIVCRLDRDDTLDDVPPSKKQKAAIGLLLDKFHKQDFAGPLACRASRVLGPISRHRIADILPHMKVVSITLAYAHAYQTTCLAQHFPGVPHRTFRPFQAQVQVSIPSQ